MAGGFFLAGIGLLLIGLFAPIVSLFKTKKIFRKIMLSCSVLGLISLIAFALITIFSKNVFSLDLYSIGPNVLISFYADRLAAFFLLIISVVSLGVMIYSFAYIEFNGSEPKKNFMLFMMNFFIISMILVVASANFFSFLFFWELMSVSSFFLVMFEHEKPETRKAGVFYFVMTQLSTLFLIAGFIILLNSGQTFLGGGHLVNSSLTNLSFVLLFVGFGIKAGAIPFHKWLPYAHPASPSNISALMSGVMIKVAIYGIVRFLLSAVAPELWWGITILVFGSVSAVLGVIYALKEHDIKRLLAYHSIENIGIILMGIGLSEIFFYYGLTSLAMLSLIGALFHSLNHALFKSLLFMSAGSVVHSTKTRNIEEMGGLIKKMPYTAMLFLIGSISISALPPFNGFVSELMIFTAFFHATLINNPFIQILLFTALSILALTSALAAACFVKAFGITFLAMPRTKKAENAMEAPKSMIIGPAIIAFLCIFLGIFSYQIFLLAGFDFPIPDMLIVGLSMIAFTIVVLTVTTIFAFNKKRVSETWGCGINSQNPKMEYTASGFSEPIVTIFQSIYRTNKISEKKFFDSQNINFSEGSAEIKLFNFFEEYIYLPIARLAQNISEKLNRAQNRIEPEAYLLCIFLTCLAIFVIAGWIL